MTRQRLIMQRAATPVKLTIPGQLHALHRLQTSGKALHVKKAITHDSQGHGAL